MPRLVWLVVAVTVLLHQLPSSQSRQVTNEDIKDALLSVIHLLHGTQDKLERHELREKQLGEIVKRALGGLEKRHRSLEPIKGMLERLDERLAGVESILMQNEERQRLQSLVTNNTVEILVETIESLNNKISSKSDAPTDSKLSAQIHEIKNTLNDIKTKVDSHDKQIDKIDETTSKVIDVLTEKSGSVSIMLEKYENKLSEFNNRPTEMSAISYKEPVVDYNFQSSLDTQKSLLEQIVKDVSKTTARLDKLPTMHDVTTLSNNTMFILQELKYNMEGKNAELATVVAAKSQMLDSSVAKYHENTNKSIVDLAEFHKNVYSGIAKSYEELSNEIQAISKIEKVVIQTGDNVLDVKRRIEYGVHQVITDISELVKEQDKDLNATVNKRFDDIELTILDNQSDALANLTTKLETEMSQVWRQIGIMYQQLTASATALDRLQAQTDSYVNGSLTSMDSMTSKVGKITGKMAEVDSNLNYLMGRLSLVTHEFNQIKVGLGTALDEIRGSFQVVQNKVKNVGPGPHKIPDSENEIEKDGNP